MSEHAPKKEQTTGQKLGRPKEILRNLQLRHIGNLVGYKFPSEGSFGDLSENGNVTVSSGVNTKHFEINHFGDKRGSQLSLTIYWDETYGSSMLPGVEATCQRFRGEEKDGEVEQYHSWSNPSKNTLDLWHIIGELHFAKGLQAQERLQAVTIETPVDTTGV